MRIYNIDYSQNINEIDFDALQECAAIKISLSRHQYGIVPIVVRSEFPMEKVKYEFSPMTSKSGVLKDCVVLLNPTNAISLIEGNISELKFAENKAYKLILGIDARAASVDIYSFKATIGYRSVTISVDINDEPIKDMGTNLDQSLSSLMWLNSDIMDDRKIVAGYEPISLADTTYTLTGKSVTVAKNGMLAEVASYFNEGGYIEKEVQEQLLSAPISFKMQGQKFKQIKNDFLCHEDSARVYSFLKSESISMSVGLNISYEGKLDYVVEFFAREGAISEDIILRIPFNVSKFIIDADGKTELSEQVKHDFSAPKEANGIYVGDYKAGAVVQFMSNATFESEKEGKLDNSYTPYDSWCNYGKGYYELSQTESGVDLTTSTGRVVLAAGQRIVFKFSIFITPFKSRNAMKSFLIRDLAFDSYGNNKKVLDAAKRLRANAITCDIADMIDLDKNLSTDATQKFNDLRKQAQAIGIAVNARYTPKDCIVTDIERDYLEEFGGELIERSMFDEESFKITARSSNYYLEEINSIYKLWHVDGINVEDCIMPRKTIERLAKLTAKNNGLCGTVTATNGFAKSDIELSDAIINRIELLPFIDRYVTLSSSKDTSISDLQLKISGSLFGVGSAFNASGRSPVFPLLFGSIANMSSYTKKEADKAKMVMAYVDQHGINESELFGFWDARNPITSDKNDVYVSTYMIKDRAIIVIYNDNAKTQEFDLGINPRKGFTSKGKKIFVPAIFGVQGYTRVNFNKSLKLKGKKGMIIAIK